MKCAAAYASALSASEADRARCRPVIDYVHGKGLTFGLYTSVGDETCHGGWSPGSYNHWTADATTFASWGVRCLSPLLFPLLLLLPLSAVWMRRWTT